MKAFAYLRVSSKGQVEGDGLTRQSVAIQEFAQRQGFEILHTYQDEGVSGSMIGRPALVELMMALEENSHEAKTVIIERIDRLARDLLVQEALLANFKKHNANLISVHDGELLTDNPTRKLMRQILGAVAEYDKAMTVAKLKAARERKRLNGSKCEGRKGYGDEPGQAVLKEIKKNHRKPRGKKRLTAQQIADKMNKSGFLTLTGKKFTANSVRLILSRNK